MSEPRSDDEALLMRMTITADAVNVELENWMSHGHEEVGKLIAEVVHVALREHRANIGRRTKLPDVTVRLVKQPKSKAKDTERLRAWLDEEHAQ